MASDQILIEKGTLHQAGHRFNGQQVYILVEKGKIAKISNEPINHPTSKKVDASNCEVSAGWCDLSVFAQEPGEEYKESIKSLLKTASVSGFTDICLQPDRISNRINRSAIEFAIQQGAKQLSNILVFGQVSSESDERNFNELYDLSQGGVLGFSNGKEGYKDLGLLHRTLLYLKTLGLPLFTFANQTFLGDAGGVNESDITIHTGLKTSPSVNEYTEIFRQIELAKYNNSPLHFSTISCRESVNLIREAKENGFNITCDVAMMNLCYNDQKSLEFDSNYKVLPPLRNEDDRLALIEGLIDGTIDAIVSDHKAEDEEHKKIEYEYAKQGVIGMQPFVSMYSLYLQDKLPYDVFIEKITSGPRRILMKSNISIEEGHEACLTVVDLKAKWEFNQENNVSKSNNHPMYNHELKGRVILTVNNNQIYQL